MARVEWVVVYSNNPVGDTDALMRTVRIVNAARRAMRVTVRGALLEIEMRTPVPKTVTKKMVKP